MERKEIRILVVDDEQMMSDSLKQNLIEEGFTVDTASNGADAIEQLHPFIERGVCHFQIAFEDQRTIDKFCEEVAPQVAQL